jgi:hypothetical protein
MQVQDKTISKNSISQALQKLCVFTGEWALEGELYEGEGLIGHAAWITTLENFDELGGGLCLVHRIKGDTEENEIAYIDVIGYNETDETYKIHSFYSDGKTHEWLNQEQNGIWTLTGYAEAEGKLMQVRSTTIFGDGGNVMKIQWEQLNDTGEWQTFWNIKANKIMQST